MNNTIEYKGYIGTVEFSEPDGIFFGKVQGIRSLVSYEGTSAKELIKDFHNAVEDYISSCAKAGKDPEVAYKGSFNVRIGAELHKKAVIYAIAHEQSLNSFVAEAIKEKLLRVAI